MFKNLQNKIYGYVNLNLEAKYFVENVEEGDLLDSEFCQKVVDFVHKKYGLDFSYGGWMEDRSFLWKGSYLEHTENFIHLGVDVNVTVGTEVFADLELEVLRIENDFPLNHGWGNKLIGYNMEKDICILYAHMGNDIVWKEGDIISPGEVIGKVGNEKENGFWFPHLHLQAFRKEYFDHVDEKNIWKEFDGYGSANELEQISKRYLDPLNFVKII